jgi:hypothetical protein
MKKKCRIRIAQEHFDTLHRHLFPGDNDEHGAVLLAGISQTNGQLTLLVRELHLAVDGVDYTEGKIGYRALNPSFIHRLITRARDEKLVYLAVHNHFGDYQVDFSQIDLDSHERGYPALLQISRGLPVGALVFGRRSVAADLWVSRNVRTRVDDFVVVGRTIQRLESKPGSDSGGNSVIHDRQVRMFGKSGQLRLSQTKVAVIGVGGLGSLVAEYLARLGIGHFILVDNDAVEETNLSRIVGAFAADARKGTPKVKVAKRLIRGANKNAKVTLIPDDVAKESVAKKLVDCDYLFLAADSMRARLVFNALVHQYLIPGVQLGSKIRQNPDGTLADVMSANRPVRPGYGCLWCNQLIDTTALAKEAKSDEERKAQEYGVEEPNPSVISLNAIAAAHGVNDFLLDYLGLRDNTGQVLYEHFHCLSQKRDLVQPRKDSNCSECSYQGFRFGRGDSVELPCISG